MNPVPGASANFDNPTHTFPAGSLYPTDSCCFNGYQPAVLYPAPFEVRPFDWRRGASFSGRASYCFCQVAWDRLDFVWLLNALFLPSWTSAGSYAFGSIQYFQLVDLISSDTDSVFCSDQCCDSGYCYQQPPSFHCNSNAGLAYDLSTIDLLFRNIVIGCFWCWPTTSASVCRFVG